MSVNWWIFVFCLGYNLLLHYLSFKCSSFGLWEPFQLAPVSLGTILICVFLRFSLLCWHYRNVHIHLIYSLPQAPETYISPKSLSSFNWRTELETKIGAAVLLVASAVQILLKTSLFLMPDVGTWKRANWVWLFLRLCKIVNNFKKFAGKNNNLYNSHE